jgi:probable HAF family extracellular repeat protein
MRSCRCRLAAKILRAALLASSALIAAPSLAQAQSASFQGVGFLPGDTYSYAFGVSSDGLVVVGRSDSGAAEHAFRWNGGAMTNLGLLPGMTNAVSNAVNADGSVVVGDSYILGAVAGEAFRWTGSVMTPLGFLAGTTQSVANGVSGDGSVVVGESFTPAPPYPEFAFIWTQGSGMVSLGVLPGGTLSVANGISADGSTVVGVGDAAGIADEGVVWKVTGTTVTTAFGLGLLSGGTFTDALAVNANGSVVVGFGDSPAYPSNEAIRWTVSGTAVLTTTELGALPGDTNSQANAVNADGSVVVGQSGGGGGNHAFRWTAANGMQSVQSLLVAAGVNMTGWSLQDARGVSANGSIIVGYGSNPSSVFEGWIARLCDLAGANCPAGGSGIITPDIVAQSFSGLAAMGQSGNAAIGNALGTFTEYATQAGTSQGSRNTPYSAFGYGGYDSDPAASGTLGMTVNLPDKMVAGAAVSANYVKTDMVFDGNSKMAGGSAGVFVARVPDAGLQWLAGVTGITLKGDITRGYLNGSGLASSTGSTTANGYGATGRIGWSFDRVLPKTQVTPFASYTFASIHFNGYTETGGPFPAQLNAFTSNAQTSRLGADARYTIAPGKWLWGTLAWAHRLDGGKGADISGTLIGLFALTTPGASVAQDWAEVTGGVRWPIWQNGAMTASLTASVPTNFPTTYAARVGVTQAF